MKHGAEGTMLYTFVFPSDPRGSMTSTVEDCRHYTCFSVPFDHLGTRFCGAEQAGQRNLFIVSSKPEQKNTKYAEILK